MAATLSKAAAGWAPPSSQPPEREDGRAQSLVLAGRKVHPVDDAHTSRGAPSTPTSVGVGDAPHEPPSSSSSPPLAHSGLVALSLHIPEWLRRGLWLYLLLYQLANTTLLGYLAYLYATAGIRDSMFWYLRANFLFSRAAAFLDHVSAYVFVAYLLFAGFFLYGTMDMLVATLSRGRLAFGVCLNVYSHHPHDDPPAATAKPPPRHKKLGICYRARSCIVGGYRLWQSIGIRGRYFAETLIFREALEATLQTIQAHSTAKSISNVPVNVTYAIVIFVNSWSSFVYGYLFRADQAHRRLACVITDLTLDFIWGTIVPLVIFAPYVRAYYSGEGLDPTIVWPDTVEREVEEMLVLSLSSFILSIFPFVSSLGNLRGVRRLLDEANKRPRRLSISLDSLTQIKSPMMVSRRSKLQVACSAHRSLKSLSFASVIHSLMVIYGTIILIVSLALSGMWTTFPVTQFECNRPLYPWLTTKEACAGRRINCTLSGIVGTRDELTATFDLFDEASLLTLIIVDCPGLDVPPSIHQFHHLRTINIQFSTIARWDLTAGLDNERLANLQTLKITSSEFLSPPLAIYRVTLPETMEWISFYKVDSTAFVDQIGSSWENLKYLYLDDCNLDSVPNAVAMMHELIELSLTYNPINIIDGTYFTDMPQITRIWLDETNISSIPDEVWSLSSNLLEIYIEQTHVASHPPWVADIARQDMQIHAAGTPLCDSVGDTDPVVNCDKQGTTYG